MAFTSAPNGAGARKIHGVPFDEMLQEGNRSLELRGLAVKDVTVFNIDIYAVALYREHEPATGDGLMASEGMKAVVLEFLRDVNRGRLIGSWMRDFSRNCRNDSLLREAAVLAQQLPDIKKGQRVTYVLAPEGVDVLIGQRKLGFLGGREAGDAVLAAFVGERAPRKLREDLLRPLDGVLR